MAGLIYPWGNEAPDKERCNFNINVKDTTSAEQYLQGASFYGCLDMAGNVWEWTSTKWLDNYQNYASKVDPSLEGDDRRVVRGGSFYFNPSFVRCAYRVRFYPSNRNCYVGFRVVAVSPS